MKKTSQWDGGDKKMGGGEPLPSKRGEMIFHCFGGIVDDIQHKILSFVLSDILLWELFSMFNLFKI